MQLIEFVNPNPHSVHLVGPDKRVVVIGSRRKAVLQDWFSRYAPALIRPVRPIGAEPKTVNHPAPRPVPQRPPARPIPTPERRIEVRRIPPRNPAQTRVVQIPRSVTVKNQLAVGRQHIVGHTKMTNEHATKFFRSVLPLSRTCMSNDIGIGILSFNRLHCIQRLLDSIHRFTNLQQTSVFVSDESTDDNVKAWLRTVDWIVLIDNAERLGVAGNANRLMQCLDRFKYKILLNDDVEILARGWELAYPRAMADTGYHHFCYRQPGVYGASARDHTESKVGNHLVRTIREKPHGAVMAFDDTAFKKVGFFDESMGLYGMEHVDWSNRVALSGIQSPGYHDVAGSDGYFKIHSERSAMEDRGQHFLQAREQFNQFKDNKSRIFIDKSQKSTIPGISCIIPCRGADRFKSINAVVACVKAQDFPVIEIIVVEEDDAERIRVDQLANKMFVKCRTGTAFNKAAAFNRAASAARHDILVLQDADIIYHREYFKKIRNILTQYDACHIGKDVIYMDDASTRDIGNTLLIDGNMQSSSVVGYFEGGSLACSKKAFFSCGGFLEEFEGYGCEDCEFFERLKKTSKFNDERTETFIHLSHGRVQGWKAHHSKNKSLHESLRSRFDLPGLVKHCIARLRNSGYAGILDALQIK